MICTFNNEARHSDCRVVSLLWLILSSVCQERECPSRMQKYHCYWAVCCNYVRFALVVELLKWDEVMINTWKIMEHMRMCGEPELVPGQQEQPATSQKCWETKGPRWTMHYKLQWPAEQLAQRQWCLVSGWTFGTNILLRPDKVVDTCTWPSNFMRLPCFMAQQEWSLELAREECDWNMVEKVLYTETDLSL